MSEDKKSLEKRADGQFRRWKLEITAALKREKNWRKEVQGLWDIYKGKKKVPFNILWSNVETLRPSLYNSTPKPDVRRRFRDEDKLGKAVSEVLERGSTYSVDCSKLDDKMKLSVLDALVAGRACANVKYVPTIEESESSPVETKEGMTQEDTELDAEVTYESVEIEHNQWDDFIHGEGKTWPEVMWGAKRHKLSREDAENKFGKDKIEGINFDTPSDPAFEKKDNDDIKPVFMTADFWEIWDKEKKKVHWINFGYNQGLLYPLDNPDGIPPVNFKEFYPWPEPLRLVEDSTSMLPTTMYSLYKEQAEELNILTQRILKMEKALRVRALYDGSMEEVADLIKADAQDFISIKNAAMWADKGLDKAIMFMPLDMLAKTLQQLYIARDQCKQVIYEITGISDVIRGATNAAETATAQQIKNQWGTLRLQRLQREVQRYVKDLIRLQCEVIAEKFSYQTMAKMTGLKFPTNMEKQQAQYQYQQHMQQIQVQAQQTGQQPQQVPPPEILNTPSWEDIDAMLKNNPDREFRIDIETDSTIASTLSEDMQGLQEIMTGLGGLLQTLGPAVQQGFVSVETVKSLAMVMVRRAKMGLEVEDQLEKGIQQPPQQPDPNAAKAQADMKAKEMEMQAKQAEMQQNVQMEQQRMQAEQASRQAEIQANIQIEQARMSANIEIERNKAELQAQLEREKMQMEFAQKDKEMAFERWKIELETAAKIEVADISAEASKENAATQAATKEIASEVTQ